MVGLLAFTMCFIAVPLIAQDADQPGADEQPAEAQKAAPTKRFAGEVTVTAQKREEELIDVPISVKAIPADTIEKINAQELADIARLVPSMSITDLQRGNNNVQIRGLGSNVGNVGTVALFNDGIISAMRSQTNGTFAEQDSALYDVERVEVLRGPQGTLYGEGSFGGVINIISKRPDPQKFSASLSADYFSIKDGDSSNYNLAAMVNVPLVQDKWALRVVGHTRDRGGYVDAVNALPVFFGMPAELVGEDLNTEKFHGGRVSLGYHGDKVVANLILKTQKAELGISNYTSPTTIEFVNMLGGTSFDTELSQALFGTAYGSESTINEGVLDIDVVTGAGTLTSITGFGDVDADNFASDAHADNRAFSQELRLSSESSGALNYTVGAYYRSSTRDITFSGSPFGDTSLDQWSIYGQLYWDISEVVRATLGVAYAEFSSEVTDSLNGLPTAKNDFDDVSPKIALNWQPNQRTNAYVSVAKGFRAGGANIDESFGTDPNFQQGFDPDTIWNYEIGLK